jgi:Holliday junction resolvasome RuvABC endonuclease subunit
MPTPAKKPAERFLARAMGADPGDTCGLAVVEFDGLTFTVLAAVGLKMSTKGGQRAIGQFMDDCARFAPIAGLAMEEPGYMFARREFQAKGTQQAMAIGLRIGIGQGQRRGELRARAVDRGIPLLDQIPQQTVKAAVASGRATKEQMIAAVRARTGYAAETEHVADAIAVAMTALKALYLAHLTKEQRHLPKSP